MTANIIQIHRRTVRDSWATSDRPLENYEKEVVLLARMMIDRGVEAGQSLEQIRRRLARSNEEESGSEIADSVMVDLHIEMAAEVERRIRAERQLFPDNNCVVTFLARK